MTDPAVPEAIAPQPAYDSHVPPAAAVAPVPLRPAQPRRNPAGIAAFVVGVSAFLSPAIAVLGGFAIIGRAPMSDDLDLFTVLLFGAIGAGIGCAVGLVATVLAIISFVLRDRKRLWGILGLVLGAIAVLVGWIPLVAYITSGGASGPTGVPLNG